MLHVNNHWKVEQYLFQILICITTFSIIIIYCIQMYTFLHSELQLRSCLFLALIPKGLFLPIVFYFFFTKCFIQLPAYLHNDNNSFNYMLILLLGSEHL